jgi:hypothetical protein
VKILTHAAERQASSSRNTGGQTPSKTSPNEPIQVQRAGVHQSLNVSDGADAPNTTLMCDDKRQIAVRPDGKRGGAHAVQPGPAWGLRYQHRRQLGWVTWLLSLPKHSRAKRRQQQRSQGRQCSNGDSSQFLPCISPSLLQQNQIAVKRGDRQTHSSISKKPG